MTDTAIVFSVLVAALVAQQVIIFKLKQDLQDAATKENGATAGFRVAIDGLEAQVTARMRGMQTQIVDLRSKLSELEDANAVR